MQVKVLATLRGPEISANIGDIITIEDTKANKLILAGAVEEIKQEPVPEIKEEPVPEIKQEPVPEIKEEPVPSKATSKKKR